VKHAELEILFEQHDELQNLAHWWKIMEVYVKKFKSQGELVVAACDPEILGNCYREGKLVLDVKREFYEGLLVSCKKALEEIESSTIANIVGERIISEAIRAGLICEECVLTVAKVPHAQRIVI